jgi:hypothetical protein
VDQVSKYWGHEAPKIGYDIDPCAIERFAGTHPAIMKSWIDKHAESHFSPDPNHKLTKREKKHRWSMKLEKWFGLDLSRKHYKLIK